MRRRTRLTLVAAAIGLMVPVAINTSIASAVDQDLTLSVAAGPAGTAVEVTSASCVPDDANQIDRFLSVRLISGTAPNEVLAGAASGYADSTAVMIIPDWIDPLEPAVVEAICYELDYSTDNPVEVSIPYDPAPFDVEASLDPPVQERTFSRTSLLAGQSFAVEGSGCFIDDAEFASVDVVEGDDLSGRTMGSFVAYGGGEVDAGTFATEVAMTNAGFGLYYSESEDGDITIEETEEYPTDIPAGTYTALPYCVDDEGAFLMYEPELIEVTGDAPFADIDLVIPAETRDVALTGGSCTSGDVMVEAYASDAADLSGGPFQQGDTTTSTNPDALAAPAAFAEKAAAADGRSSVRGSTTDRLSARPTRALSDEGFVEATLTPTAEGGWSVTDAVAFDNGFVEGYAMCGDPLADGFYYDPQIAVVKVTPILEVTTTTTAPPSPPANAVSGTPTYAG